MQRIKFTDKLTKYVTILISLQQIITVEKLKSLIKKLIFIVNNSKFKVIIITMLLLIKFIMYRFTIIW